VHAAYGRAMVNAGMVNADPVLLKLPVFWQKFAVSPPFRVIQNYS
jgi:hypothetical protein